MYWKAFEPRIGLAHGRCLAATRPSSEPATASSTIPPGTRVLRASGRIRPFSPSPTFLAPAGCPLTTSFCYTSATLIMTSELMSTGFPIFTAPPTLSSFSGTLFYQPTNFKLGSVQQFNANVERQLPGNVVLTAGYAGARGHHILVSGNDINTDGPTCVYLRRKPHRVQSRRRRLTCRLTRYRTTPS